MNPGESPPLGAFDGIDVEAVCLAALDVLDAHMPMVAAALAATDRLVRGGAEAAAKTSYAAAPVADGGADLDGPDGLADLDDPDGLADLADLRERVGGLVGAARGLAGRIGRGADLALHLLAERPDSVEPLLAARLRCELLDRIGDLGGLSARLRMAERQLAGLGSDR